MLAVGTVHSFTRVVLFHAISKRRTDSVLSVDALVSRQTRGTGARIDRPTHRLRWTRSRDTEHLDDVTLLARSALHVVTDLAVRHADSLRGVVPYLRGITNGISRAGDVSARIDSRAQRHRFNHTAGIIMAFVIFLVAHFAVYTGYGVTSQGHVFAYRHRRIVPNLMHKAGAVTGAVSHAAGIRVRAHSRRLDVTAYVVVVALEVFDETVFARCTSHIGARSDWLTLSLGWVVAYI